MPTSLAPSVAGPLVASLAVAAPPVPRAARQPLHVVYGGAHRFAADTAPKLGALARAAFDRWAPEPETLTSVFGVPVDLADDVHARVRARLAERPVADFRVDFEDGFGPRSDDDEDAAAIAAARALAAGHRDGTLPPFVGLRIKALTPATGARGLRTLDLFLTEATAAGPLPSPFVVTLPKIDHPRQVEVLADALDALEAALGLRAGHVGVELMIETPGAIVGPEGRLALPALARAARGRAVAAHFGAYDYTAALGIPASAQTLGHPACEHARQQLLLGAAAAGLAVSDGATTTLPIGPHARPASPADHAENARVVHHAWALHAGNVRHALATGFPQGWDLHPAQIPARLVAAIAFFREGFGPAADRLRRFLDEAAQPVRSGATFDDAATGQGLLNTVLSGIECGALSPAEVTTATGLAAEELGERSFAALATRRRHTRDK